MSQLFNSRLILTAMAEKNVMSVRLLFLLFHLLPLIDCLFDRIDSASSRGDVGWMLPFMQLQLPLPLPPVRQRPVQQLIKRGGVVVFDQVAEFVGDDVVDAGWGSLDQEQV